MKNTLTEIRQAAIEKGMKLRSVDEVLEGESKDPTEWRERLKMMLHFFVRLPWMLWDRKR
jgi:hypothetical protein